MLGGLRFCPSFGSIDFVNGFDAVWETVAANYGRSIIREPGTEDLAEENVTKGGKRERLRCGFSTGTAACAASMAALRMLLTGRAPAVVAVRLPSGVYLPISIAECCADNGLGHAVVIKDGGDDPDVTNRARIRAEVRIVDNGSGKGGFASQKADVASGDTEYDPALSGKVGGIFLIAGEGVGVATKPGLPVAPGEPAINPVPRLMFSENLPRELANYDPDLIRDRAVVPDRHGMGPSIFIPLNTSLAERPRGVSLEVTLHIPGGEAVARHTLNPRLGIVGGLSILGTTGIVKPFSHEAYEETIRAAMGVAACNGCGGVVLSTGGKSERFAREMLPDEPVEGFVQVADFFSFSVREACRFGFGWIVHSVFFGKAVKMAQGHDYTHAHSAVLDLELVASIAKGLGYGEEFRREIAGANTARHALEIIEDRGALEVVQAVAAQALERSAALAGKAMSVRLLLFNYEGGLLADLSRPRDEA